ncbi:hypothetical protein A7U60_g1454 [Sanghuangporus baumii]|uniref:F-box domain-containing protein n=1 Tax=Sanghuangporus baumii TaxID=108892 RepID=A0A9Q5I402_SANBA|nr:hypothetical protein A7U60_g1454 [Sanghuangporus baumii]
MSTIFPRPEPEVVRPSFLLNEDIWLEIFNWVTFVPNAYDTHAPDPLEDLGLRSQDRIQAELGEALPMKCTLVLVCKAWKRLATRLLYRSVMIRFSMRNLLRTFKDDFGSTVSGSSKASWCIRLDILPSPLVRDYQYSDFVEILQLLDNVQIIVTRGTIPHLMNPKPGVWSFLSFFEAFRALSTRNLHVFDLTTARLSMYLYRDCHFSAAITNQPLRVFRLRHGGEPRYTAEQAVLPHLEYLNVHRGVTDELISQSVACSLVHLSLDYLYCLNDGAATRILALIGHQLRSVALQDGTPIIGKDRASDDSGNLVFLNILRSLETLCPNLHTLILELSESNLASAQLPPVSNLVLCFSLVAFRLDGRNFDAERCKQLCDDLSRLLSQTPAPNLVRLVGNLDYFRCDRRYLDLLVQFQRLSQTILSERGIRFEDEKGVLLHEFRPNKTGDV